MRICWADGDNSDHQRGLRNDAGGRVSVTQPFWAKLWIDILDDKKVADMPDWLFRRFIFFVLAAKEFDHDGLLQPVSDLAWRLRIPTDACTEALEALSKVGVTQKTADGWMLVNFKKRQVYEDSTNAERQRRYREKHRNENITTNSNDNASSSYSLSSSESIKDINKQTIFSIRDAEKLICQVCDWVTIPGGWYEPSEKVLDLLQHFGFDETNNRLITARDDWVKQKRKDNHANYRLTNPAWINNAITREKIGAPPPMSDEEHYLKAVEELRQKKQ